MRPQTQGLHRAGIAVAMILAVLAAGCAANTSGTGRPHPPFRVLYSNDTTHILTTESPYHDLGDPFRADMLHASVDETANTGIDVHILQPGQGWVPWWESEVYPYDEHAAWYRQRYGLDVSPYGHFMLEGGDIVGEFVSRADAHDMTRFISLRLNDSHAKHLYDLTAEQIEELGFDETDYISFFPTSISVSRFYDRHREYRLKNIEEVPDRDGMDLGAYLEAHHHPIRRNRLLNWEIEAVRKHKLAFIEEICENYDINGFELDFKRHPHFFQDHLSTEERVEIMTGFIRKVRRTLNRTAGEDEYRWLLVRVPFRLDDHAPIGVDVARFHEAGVDMVTLSPSYTMQQQSDLARIHQAAPQVPLYLELTHTSKSFLPVNEQRLAGRHYRLRRSVTDEQFYTAAHLAYSRGGQGVSMFNFPYYRAHEGRAGGDVAEPPFYIFEVLQDPDAVAQQPQHYYLSHHDAHGRRVDRRPIRTGWEERFAIDMAPPAGGWQDDGRLRIQLDGPWGDRQWTVRVNGQALAPTEDVSEPYPTEFEEALGRPDHDELRAWTVPVELLKDGVNKIEIAVPSESPEGEGHEGGIVFIDLALM